MSDRLAIFQALTRAARSRILKSNLIRRRSSPRPNVWFLRIRSVSRHCALGRQQPQGINRSPPTPHPHRHARPPRARHARASRGDADGARLRSGELGHSVRVRAGGALRGVLGRDAACAGADRVRGTGVASGWGGRLAGTSSFLFVNPEQATLEIGAVRRPTPTQREPLPTPDPRTAVWECASCRGAAACRFLATEARR